MKTKYGVLGSSANPEKLSATFKGVLVGLIPLVIFIASSTGFAVVEADLMQMIDLATKIISSCMILFGLCRKIYIANK